MQQENIGNSGFSVQALQRRRRRACWQRPARPRRWRSDALETQAACSVDTLVYGS